MLVPLQDRNQLRTILRDIEAQFASLPLFRGGRREIVYGYMRHAASICAVMEALHEDWLDRSSPNLPRAAKVLISLTDTFRAILRTAATVPPGSGDPGQEAVREAANVGLPFVTVTGPLTYMLDSGGWGTASYDAETRELELASQEDEIQARESFNSVRLRAAKEKTLREGMGRGLSADPDPNDVHGNDIEQLNPAYTRSTFDGVMRALRAKAPSGEFELCTVVEVNLEALETEIAAQSGLATRDVALVIGDLLFTFDPKQDGNQCLVELEPGRVAFIPLLVAERELYASDYIRISKRRYPSAYGARQKGLTRSLEERVGDALRVHAPGAEVRPLRLPSDLPGVDGGEVDQVAADPAGDALLLVQVKYLFDHDNALIAEGIVQLQRDERIMRARWSEVSKALKGWEGRAFPEHLGKLLVTNWFLGTEARPEDVRVVSLDDIAAVPPLGSVRRLIEWMRALPEPLVFPQYRHRIELFGYKFIHHTTTPPEPEA